MFCRLVHRTLLLFVAFTILASCSEREVEPDEPDYNLEPAIIYDTAPIEVDGCGWLVITPNIHYSPTNLEDEYMENELHVLIAYDILTDTLKCGLGPAKLVKIEILEIQKQ